MNKLLRMCRFIVFASVLSALLLIQTGCGAGLGETKAEAHRRRMRILSINMQEIPDDLDLIFMMDKPSTLTEKLVR